MIQNVRVDLTGVGDIDPSTGVKAKIPMRGPHIPLADYILEPNIIAASSLLGPRGNLVKEVLGFRNQSSLRLLYTGSITVNSVAVAMRACTYFTIALGPCGSIGAIGTVGLSGGIYGANMPKGGEWGFFGSVSYGVLIGASASIVGQFQVMHGAPADTLGGDTMTIGVDISTPGKTVTTGGFLIFSTDPWGAITGLIGFGGQFGVGAGAFPVDIYMTRSKTTLKPIFGGTP